MSSLLSFMVELQKRKKKIIDAKLNNNANDKSFQPMTNISGGMTRYSRNNRGGSTNILDIS